MSCGGGVVQEGEERRGVEAEGKKEGMRTMTLKDRRGKEKKVEK